MADEHSNGFPPSPDQIVSIPVRQLRLDPHNPRLSSISLRQDKLASQDELVRMLWNEMAVNEVAASIAANGYLHTEPLFVIKGSPYPGDESAGPVYTVVEGNRRLAAVLLLRTDSLRTKIRATNIPNIGSDARTALDVLPATVYRNRVDLWPYLGFRHINGPQKWDSFSKAQYVANVYENFNVSLEEIAERIGDYHSTVARFYRGYTVLRQAEQQTDFDREDRVDNRFYFSHLYTAVSYTEFQNYLGITPENSLAPQPVPETHLANLEQVMLWLYGRRSRGIEPIVRKQDPDLNTLREVIGDPEALDVLRSGYSLDRAFKTRIGDAGVFHTSLVRAKIELQNAASTVSTGYKGEESLNRTIQDIAQLADQLWNTMDSIRSEFKPDGRRIRRNDIDSRS